jgi:hypothetical protein
MAATLETASRGVIYEHAPQSPAAKSLVEGMKTLLAQMRERGTTVYDGEAAMALRAIERGARTLRAPNESDTVYLELVGRLLQVDPAEAARGETAASGSLILP